MTDALARPRQGLGDVSSELTNFAITTWDVAPEALAAYLPDFLEPDVFELDDGRTRAFVSAVSFVNRQFFVGFAPFVRLTCRQTNFRAYVRRGDARAVWFFGTSLGSRFVVLPRYVWRLPWAYARGRSEARWQSGGLERLSWHQHGALGEERLELEGTGAPMGRLDGFADEALTREVLTHPLVGYLRRRSGDLATYSVWHEPLRMERARVIDARYALFERLGLVEPDAPPHSALVQQRTHYLIFLPPRRVRRADPTHIA